MTLVSSGTIALQDAGTNTTSSQQTHYLNANLVIGNRSATCYIRVQETDPEPGVGPFYQSYDLVSGTQYGYSITTGTSAKTPMADTNPVISGFTNSSTSGYTQDFGYDEWEDVADNDYTYLETSRSTAGGWDFGGGNGNIGSLAGLTTTGVGVTLANGTTYTCNMIAWQRNSAQGHAAADDTANRGNYLALGFSSSAMPNTDAGAFKEITVNGVTFQRSDAKQFDGYENGGGSFWRWEPTDAQLTTMGTSGTVNVKLSSATTTGTFNNGIAEEFGGNDSSNVAISDYYRGGTHVPSTASSNIPASGEIAFSDFYGTSDIVVPSNIHETALVAGQTGGYGYALSGYSTVQSIGSITDGTITTFDSSSNTFSVRELRSFASSTGATSGSLIFSVESSSVAASNAGFTTLKLWLNQNTSSGTPDHTFSRTTGSYSGSGNVRVWSWSVSVSSGSVYSTFFGSTNTTNYYMELV